MDAKTLLAQQLGVTEDWLSSSVVYPTMLLLTQKPGQPNYFAEVFPHLWPNSRTNYEAFAANDPSCSISILVSRYTNRDFVGLYDVNILFNPSPQRQRWCRVASTPGVEYWEDTEVWSVLLWLTSLTQPELLSRLGPLSGCVHVFHTLHCGHQQPTHVRSDRWKQQWTKPA
jgi:hypothetical protein